MQNPKTNRVVEFPYGGAAFDKKNLSESLQTLPWRLRAQSLLDLMGYHESDALDGTACCAKNSHAGQMGCKTLEELCVYLDLEESDIVSELSALHLSSKKSISGDTPSDILSNHKQVVSVLGREPINSSEVMDAISYVKDDKISSLTQLKVKLEGEIGIKNKRIVSLQEEVKSKELEASDARRQLSVKISDLEDCIHTLKDSHKQEVTNLVTKHESDLIKSNKATEIEITRYFEIKLEDLKKDHDEQAVRIKQEHSIAVAQLQKIIDQEMVSIHEFDRANLENEQLRDVNRDNLVKIKGLVEKLEMLGNDDFELIDKEMHVLKDKLSKLEAAYLVTQEACIKYKHANKKLRDSLEKEIEKKVGRVLTANEQANRKRKVSSDNSLPEIDDNNESSFYGWVIPIIGTSIVVISYLLFVA